MLMLNTLLRKYNVLLYSPKSTATKMNIEPEGEAKNKNLKALDNRKKRQADALTFKVYRSNTEVPVFVTML